MSSQPKRIVILGSTGSIGTQTLDVVRAHRDRFEVIGLACASNCDLLFRQLEEFEVPQACVRDLDGVHGQWPPGRRRLLYPDGLTELAAGPDTDVVVIATVGDVGFRPTEAALRAGNSVALASKEMLVMGGPLFRVLADRTGARILPIDSEHSALWQCLAGEDLDSVRRLVLTASGGPFRDASVAQIRQATARQALNHPNWSMGPKVTVDSASLMNKGLEVIEAHWLFGLPYDRIDVIVHPESIVHSMVEFHDGSLKAQLGPPDMRLPIQYALGHPQRLDNAPSSLDLSALRELTFEPPDRERFPLLGAAIAAGHDGGTAPATLCGADDAAVELFLQGKVSFGQMTDAVLAAMDDADPAPLHTLDDALNAYAWGVEHVRRVAASRA